MATDDEHLLNFERSALEHDRTTLARFVEDDEAFAMKNWGEGVERRVLRIQALEQKLGVRSPLHSHDVTLEMARTAREAGHAGLCRTCMGRGRIDSKDCTACGGKGNAKNASSAAVAKRTAAIAAAKRAMVATPAAESTEGTDYESTDCETCGGTGTIDGETCETCGGDGKVQADEQETPPPRKSKQTPPPEAGVADLERRIGRVEARYGITPARTPRAVERQPPQKENAVMAEKRRLVDHGFVTLEEKGSPAFMELARAYAAEHKVPLEVAMVAVAKQAPSLVR